MIEQRKMARMPTMWTDGEEVMRWWIGLGKNGKDACLMEDDCNE